MPDKSVAFPVDADVPAARLQEIADGRKIRVAGVVICRQQPGTAKGFVFLSLEDETGIASVILKPDVFPRLRITVLGNSYLIVDGRMQNQKEVFSVSRSMRQSCFNDQDHNGDRNCLA